MLCAWLFRHRGTTGISIVINRKSTFWKKGEGVRKFDALILTPSQHIACLTSRVTFMGRPHVAHYPTRVQRSAIFLNYARISPKISEARENLENSTF